MNLHITLKNENRSFGKVAFFYFRGGFMRILFWPWVRQRSIYYNTNEVKSIQVLKKQKYDETNSTIKVM